MNPYKSLPDSRFWRKAVARKEFHRINPVTETKFRLTKSLKIATAGSCFAQHISRKLSDLDFNFYCTEADANLSANEAFERNFGIYSARYGNIYTVHQLNQLFDRAFERRYDPDVCWDYRNSAVVDPFRPNIEPNGYRSIDCMISDRIKHLDAVRTMFATCDVFVFTLGLTEAWRFADSKLVVPLAPGVVAGEYESTKYEFRNFNFDEIRFELFNFIEKFQGINVKAKILLTVSPVPLIATYSARHVLVASTYSKSVLRAVAEEAYVKYGFVDYFPSFEIITGSPTGGLYYESDAREVNKLGVSHAMRCFVDSYLNENDTDGIKVLQSNYPTNSELHKIVCDEEDLDI